MLSWTAPTRKAIRTAAWILSSCAEIDPMALSRAIEIALVGPLMSWREESRTAPIVVITTAVYRPYSAGRPAIMA